MVDLLPVRLPEPIDQDAIMRHRSILSEPFVRGDEYARFRNGYRPEICVGDTLLGTSSNVLNIVSHRPKRSNGHPRNIFINQGAHPSEVRDLDRRDLLFC